jgi:hypothetical protein
VSKMNYTPYVGVYDANRAIVRKTHDKHAAEAAIEKTMLSMIDEIMEQAMQINNRTAMQIEHLTLLDEINWRSAGHNVLFPSRGLSEALLASKFAIDPADFAVPFSDFSVAIPRGLVWHGAKIRPMLVGYDTGISRNASYKKIYVRNGLRPISIYNKDPESMNMRVTMTSPVIVDGIDTRAIARASFNSGTMRDILTSDEKPEDAMAIAGRMEKIECGALSDVEKKEMYFAFKLVVGLCLFIQSFPDSMTDGLPKDITVSTGKLSKTCRPRLVGRDIMGENERRGSVGVYHRGLHFRSYPTRKDGTKLPGIVKVQAHWCGGKITPHTVGQETVSAAP